MSIGLEVDQNGALDGVNKVVIQALSKLVPERMDDQSSGAPRENYLSQIYEAVLATDRDALLAVVRDMRLSEISSACIAQEYVPSVARRLGEAWLADTLDFGAVTIGSARLQSLLWKLEKDWFVPPRSLGNAPPAFLVGIPEGNQHTLGATVLAGQLRHLGMCVSLDLELTVEALTEYVSNQQLSAVLLSAAACDDLEEFRKLVDITHQQSRNTPVIIGGSILEHSPDIQSFIKADFVTNSAHDVLWYCDVFNSSATDTACFVQDKA